MLRSRLAKLEVTAAAALSRAPCPRCRSEDGLVGGIYRIQSDLPLADHIRCPYRPDGRCVACGAEAVDTLILQHFASRGLQSDGS